jgi:hypothetical protein
MKRTDRTYLPATDQGLTSVARNLEWLAKDLEAAANPKAEQVRRDLEILRTVIHNLSLAYTKLPHSVPQEAADAVVQSVYGRFTDEFEYAPEG